MGIRFAALALALSAVIISSCAQKPTPTATPTNDVGFSNGAAPPYAGWQTRPIKALAPDRVEDLLAGRGAGYALAAELNHYPGPTHVLAMAAELELNPEQENRVRDIFTAMQQETQPLGRALVDREAELDRGFRESTITEPVVDDLTSEIARVEGQLRSVHLAAHIKLKDVLTPEQVQRYDNFRGYGGMGAGGDPGHSGMHTAH